MTKEANKPSKSLSDVVATLKSISSLKVSSSPKKAAVYLAAINLLLYLKADQTTLHNVPSGQCPPPDKIPAITAVTQDQRLFQALLNCLAVTSSKTLEYDRSELTTATSNGAAASRLHPSSSSHALHHGGLHQHHTSFTAGRKRANSVSSEVESHANKAMKLTHSPVPTTASRLFSYNRNSQPDSNASSEHSPTMNVQVVAATILFMAFSHLDHWPVQLVRAYAEDCFGPRSWVDDERCKPLVDNLSLAHTLKEEENGDTPMLDSTFWGDATKVAETYKNLRDLPPEQDDTATITDQVSPAQQGRRGSLSSQSSGGPIGHYHSASVTSFPRATSQDESDVSKNKGGRKSKLKAAKAAGRAKDEGSSSSSGEEDEEVIVTTKSTDMPSPKKKKLLSSMQQGDRALSPSGSSHAHSELGETSKKGVPLHHIYPIKQQKLNLTCVRQRYFGLNLEYAHIEIAASLTERLDAKVKQNSGLLQSLHSFTSIPSVRSQIAGNLEKWLQSPGLSGLARTLFALTVKHMKNVDPPLPADVEAIKKILSMRLKANQLSAHVENITAIAAGIPTVSVARQMYHQLLSEILNTIGRGADASSSDHLKMIGAIYSALPKGISADGIAASLLMMIGNSIFDATSERTRLERSQLVKHLKHLIQLIAQQLGGAFDSCKLLESLMTFDIKDESWTVEDEEDRARLMFQCVMLLVPPLSKEAARHIPKSLRKGSVSAEPSSDTLKEKLTTARKLLLTWFCTDYGPYFPHTSHQDDDKIVGAGAPDYDSALGGVNKNKGRPRWLNTARCLLFMEQGDSPHMQRFVRSNHFVEDNDQSWSDERYRIDQCVEYGCDFDDEMMWIVLKSSSLEEGGINPDMALTLLEHLFGCCSVHRRGSLKITDMMLAWELYTLAMYEPPEVVQTKYQKPASQFDDAEEDGAMEETFAYSADLDLPQLALPGKWWRVTILALVMCGVAPIEIGSTVWEEHPTLRAMIKMVTSVRYRFPTVDCDDMERSEMKKDEQNMREEESRIAESLFMPPKPPPKGKKDDLEATSHFRARISARQQQKREQALKKEREKEAAEALLEENRRKKKLRAAQKTIMLWDPTSPARKPPREAAELLVAVESHFGLSKTFQGSTEPDFLLMTIGKTTRGAIERAYDWLIPIISDMPTTIARLHASASCVLLLRAYGTEGDERAQLKELSTPLLRHVRDSLTGRFGESDAVRAFDLLMTDVASHNPDRRRCARRVLYDSIGKVENSGNEETAPKSSSWMLNILRLEHAKSLVSDAIKHMSTAVTFERGLVLRNLLVTLDELILYARKNGITGDWDFTDIFIGLISNRPSVCAETMDRFADLRTLGIKTVYQEFKRSIQDSTRVDPSTSVTISLCREHESEESTLSLALLQAASVLLSLWTEGKESKAKQSSNGNNGSMADEEEASAAISDLASMLLYPIDANEGQLRDGDGRQGLASARIAGTEKSAVSVESWVMLAKARSDAIARRAALTAPNGFLPRLLLCSGLPKASLLTMIDRLGMMGDKSSDSEAVFSQLLVPSAASEWDIGRLGQRREVAQKLLGRLSAYLRLNEVTVKKVEAGISTTFLDWLSKNCVGNDKPRKLKNKQKSKAAAVGLSTLADASKILQILGKTEELQGKAQAEEGKPEELQDKAQAEEDLDTDLFRPGMVRMELSSDIDGFAAETAIQNCVGENEPDVLEDLLRAQAGTAAANSNPLAVESSRFTGLAVLVLRSYVKMRKPHDSLSRVVLSWVPYLSRSSGCPDLWQEMFSVHKEPLKERLDHLLSRCMTVWSSCHVEMCCEWIISKGKALEVSRCSVSRITRYLVLTSGQHSVQVDGFSARIPVMGLKNWGKSEEFVSACTNIVFENIKGAGSVQSSGDVMSRNELPDWLVLTLMLAKCGRVQMKYVCEAILQRISQPTEDLDPPLLRSVFLRLYVSNPHGMNLGIAMIRAVLMEAAEEYSTVWLDWRSPFDGQLRDIFETVMGGNGSRLVRPLVDLSKKHPLLVLRRSHLLTQFLEKDAAMAGRNAKESRGVVHGQNLTGPLDAVKSGRIVKVNVRHWGFSYSEHVWIALLDIIGAVPGPVLFSCGLSMGLLDFLNVNIRLVFVQSQLKRSEKDSRLKEKLKELFAAFQKSNKSGWEKWLLSPAAGLPSLGKTKNVMMICDFLDPQAAADLCKAPS